MTPTPPVVLGREDTVTAVIDRLSTHGLVTLVGVGGIGKTTVARAVAAQAAPLFPDGRVFVDLARLSSPAHVPGALAAALGLSADLNADAAVAHAALANALRARRLLVVLDNCESLVDAAAALALALLGAGEARILATSREPLGVAGEMLHRIGALPYPPPMRDAAAATGYAAVALFLQRAALDAPGPDDLRAVGEICRRLDGIPLAIELAAAHAAALGVRGLLVQLGDRMLSLAASEGGSVATRHHTLQATLAWSHALLTPAEQAALRRLATFRSQFRLADAIRVVADEHLSEPGALEALTGLAAKSLLAVDLSRPEAAYRLLETTRAFALQQLAAAPDGAAVRRRHAGSCMASLRDAESGWHGASEPRQWTATHAHLIDDVRAAFDWATTDGADLALAADLLLAALPLAGRLSLTRELTDKLQRLLAHEPVPAWASAQTEFRLCSALGELHCMGGRHEQSSQAYARAHQLAEQLDAIEDRASAWVGLWTSAHFSGRYADMLHAAQALAQHATKPHDPGMALFALRGTALALHYLGDHEGAAANAWQALAHRSGNLPASHVMHTVIDREVAMRMILARTLWLRGLPDQASELAAEAVERALKDRETALGVALSIAACPIALWRGDDDAARDMVRRLLLPEVLQAHLYGVQWGRQFDRVLDRRRASGEDPAAPRPAAWEALPSDPVEADMLATLDEALLSPVTVARVRQGLVGWCAPEVLRAEAAQVLRSAPDDIAAARERLERAMSLARFQGALAWELRVATSLAALDARTGRRVAAGALLESVYARFTEGHQTADLRAARQLLGQLV